MHGLQFVILFADIALMISFLKNAIASSDWYQKNQYSIEKNYYIILFLICEIIHGIFAWIITMGFLDAIDKNNILQITSEFLAIIIYALHSMESSWGHLCWLSGVSMDLIISKLICLWLEIAKFLLLIFFSQKPIKGQIFGKSRQYFLVCLCCTCVLLSLCPYYVKYISPPLFASLGGKKWLKT